MPSMTFLWHYQCHLPQRNASLICDYSNQTPWSTPEGLIISPFLSCRRRSISRTSSITSGYASRIQSHLIQRAKDRGVGMGLGTGLGTGFGLVRAGIRAGIQLKTGTLPRQKTWPSSASLVFFSSPSFSLSGFTSTFGLGPLRKRNSRQNLFLVRGQIIDRAKDT